MSKNVIAVVKDSDGVEWNCYGPEPIVEDEVRHEEMTIKDVPPKFTAKKDNYTGKIVASLSTRSSLDKALTRLRKREVKVLNFWRGEDGWIIRTMVS